MHFGRFFGQEHQTTIAWSGGKQWENETNTNIIQYHDLPDLIQSTVLFGPGLAYAPEMTYSMEGVGTALQTQVERISQNYKRGQVNDTHTIISVMFNDW